MCCTFLTCFDPNIANLTVVGIICELNQPKIASAEILPLAPPWLRP